MIAAEPKTAGQYQPYPEYKDSGVEWLGEVPTNWSVATLRHALAGIKNGSTATQLDEGIDTVQISRIETISTGEINHDKVGFVEFVDALHHYRLNVGDILFSHINSLPMVGNIAQYCSKIPLYHGMNLLRLQPSAKVESRYLYWWLKSTFSRKSVESLAKPAINQASIAIDQIKSIPCLYPMWDEQCIIAAFLDYETARIDRLITQQQRLIELLKEKRQAVISHAVTKGLNPNVPMKDSGVEWLGQVPEHWCVFRLKHLAAQMKAGPFGSSLTKDMYVSSGYKIYGQEQVIPGDFSIGDYYISEDKYAELRQYAVKAGDILISCVGTFGKIAVFPKDAQEGVINPRLIKVSPTEVILPEFLELVLRSQVVFEQMTLFSRGGTMDVVNIGILSEIRVTVPPILEQKSLLSEVNIRVEQYDYLVNKSENTISLLNLITHD